jgi:cysteine synthase
LLFLDPGRPHGVRLGGRSTSGGRPDAPFYWRTTALPESTADILIEATFDRGVDVVFGMPGDGGDGLMEALRKRQDRVRFVQVRHEESAALAACGEILEAALRSPGPSLVEAVVDPHEPPMPPRTTVEQAAKFAKALASGTPNRGRIAAAALAGKARELI